MVRLFIHIPSVYLQYKLNVDLTMVVFTLTLSLLNWHHNLMLQYFLRHQNILKKSAKYKTHVRIETLLLNPQKLDNSGLKIACQK